MKKVPLKKYVNFSTIKEANLIPLRMVNLAKMVNPVSACILNIQRKMFL
jgi:hypothetical protein